MQSRLEEIRAAGARVLAICGESPEENAKVTGNLKLDFPILSDLDLKVVKAFGLFHHDAVTPTGTGDIARPGVFILDGKGVIRWRYLTDNWRVRVRPETVLEQLAKIP